MIQAGIIGAAGFAGIQLAHILVRHPHITLAAAASNSLANTPLAQHYPAFAGVTNLAFCTNAQLEEQLEKQPLDVVFLAVPHTASLEATPRIVAKGALAVDLSADFRLRNAHTYETWYGTPHTQTELLAHAAFGLPELFPEDMRRAAQQHAQSEPTVIACAGCYPTATSLAAAPVVRAGFVREGTPVVVDAISGITGAGKKATERTHFCSANNNLEAYGVGAHRHTPEIEQILNLQDRLIFTPHLAPLNRGLLSTVTIPLAAQAPVTSTEQAVALYQQFYQQAYFVTVLPEGVQPRTSSVVGTNRAHIGVVYDARTHAVIATGAIDNLGKGAAGQAVQCANMALGLDERSGLENAALPV